MKIRFNQPTDGYYDKGTVLDLDDNIASIYQERGVAETPIRAAKRLVLDLSEKPDPATQAELDELVSLHLSHTEAAQLHRIRAALADPPQSFADKRADKMVHPGSVKLKKKQTV